MATSNGHVQNAETMYLTVQNNPKSTFTGRDVFLFVAMCIGTSTTHIAFHTLI